MRLCVLSYNTPHRKTAQVVVGLHNRGIKNIDFLLMPFKRRPERSVVFQHRPVQFEGPEPRSLAKLTGGKVYSYDEWPTLNEQYDYFLVCGSNLIEPAFATSSRILNVHAGLIPTVRGLDSFKWAILKGYPLGNTLHRIDEHADAGEILSHLPTPVFDEDDLQTLAARHYENEIWMLTNFDRAIEQPQRVRLAEQPPTMRMPAETEAEMVREFEAYKRRFATH
jgi:phosphoribosylglycinamide formyltransferase 1